MSKPEKLRECIKGLQKLLSSAEFASDCSSEQDLCQVLSDGEVLCTLLNRLSNGRISDTSYSAANSQFMARNNLKFFIQQCQEEFGMQAEDLFEPDDLLTMSNPEKVVNSLQKLLKRPEAPEISRRQSNVSLGSSLLKNVIKEICKHEKALVEKLTMLLRYRNELLGLLSEWSEDFVQVVFAHIEQLYLVHKEFHEKLVALADQGCEQFCRKLHNLYNEMAPKLEVYKHYFSHLPTANARMEEEFKNSPALKLQLTMLERFFSIGQVCLSFRALFDSPIRQLTSYALLFKRLKEAAENEIPDAAPFLAEAIANVTDFLEQANEYKRLGEHVAVTKAILAQINDLPSDLSDPALIGLHILDECFKVKTVKDRKLDTQMSMCLLTQKQLIVGTKLQKNDNQSTFNFSIPIVRIMEVKKCEKTFCLEVVQINGDKTVFECLKRSNKLLGKWKKLLDDTKSLNFPLGWSSDGHEFELRTLPEGMVCTKCRLKFTGLFMQGYSCSHCNQAFHPRCFQVKSRRGTAPNLRVPHRAVDIYHKNITRKRAFEILSKAVAGAYLIRDNKFGGKALSVQAGGGKVEHINIEEEPGRVALGNRIYWFDNLDAMLQYYSENSLSVHFSSINCHLATGVPSRSVKRFVPRHATLDEAH